MEFSTFFFDFILFDFFFLFRRLINLPQIIHLERGKALEIEFRMTCINHMLFDAVFATEFVFTVDAFSRGNYVFYMGNESKQVYAFILEGRETVCLS